MECIDFLVPEYGCRVSYFTHDCMIHKAVNVFNSPTLVSKHMLSVAVFGELLFLRRFILLVAYLFTCCSKCNREAVSVNFFKMCWPRPPTKILSHYCLCLEYHKKIYELGISGDEQWGSMTILASSVSCPHLVALPLPIDSLNFASL
jgi:hypothetical protein